MKQTELTSKLVLVALIATVVFSAITVPSAVAQSTSNPPIRANSVTSESIKDGEVKTNDLANNAVTSPKIADGTIQEEDIADGVIPSDNIQLNTYTSTKAALVPANGLNVIRAECEEGDLVTGGGFRNNDRALIVTTSEANLAFGQQWEVTVNNPLSEDRTTVVSAVCLDLTP